MEWLIYTGISTLVCIASMYFFKLYSRIWRYASIGELISIVKAAIVCGGVSFLAVSLCMGKWLPASLGVQIFETQLLLLGGIRFFWRAYQNAKSKKKSGQRRALIIGAGDCGTLIAKELMHNPNSEMYPVAFIDDDETKVNHQTLGIPIFGGRSRIAEAIEAFRIDDIIIALPSVSKKEISRIIEICKETRAKLKIIPKIGDLIHGNITIQEIRDVEVEDLLGRESVKVDLDGIANYVENKTVLVTGAGGSIGSELCRQIAAFAPKTLLLLGHGENSIYSIEMELTKKFPKCGLVSIIADIQDRGRMDEVFKRYGPQVVFHAAAHKHVPLMERNPAEAIKNNVLGTRNVANCADLYGAERFVLISTDKAVNPTSVMGVSKRIAEMYIQCLDRFSTTRFAAVRFGNVLGSRGSVIPRFKEQIAAGGPVTVTHPDMIRYFMTIPEASQLVIQAGALAEGGEVFVLDMGEPVKILDLAKDLIRLSGFEPNVEIEIAYTGIRPGEKLFEELLTEEEGLTSTKHNRIFIGKPPGLTRQELDQVMIRLEKVLEIDSRDIRMILQHIVPSYQNADYPKQKELSLVPPI
jgi:FlaA1/EpsC-like NDP-sugar epimerase